MEQEGRPTGLAALTDSSFGADTATPQTATPQTTTPPRTTPPPQPSDPPPPKKPSQPPAASPLALRGTPPARATATTALSATTIARAPPGGGGGAAAAASSGAAFVFPDYHRFPPMYTLQPNLATRRAQLDKWSALVLAYCRHYRIFRLVAGGQGGGRGEGTAGPVRVGDDAADEAEGAAPSIAYAAPDLFANRALDRVLPPAGVRAVLEDMRRQRRVEFVADSADQIECYVFWKTAEEWAAAVEAWVADTGQRGGVLTLYELTAGDATRGSPLHGLDPAVLQRALAVLVKRGKARVFGAEGEGVKFF